MLHDNEHCPPSAPGFHSCIVQFDKIKAFYSTSAISNTLHIIHQFSISHLKITSTLHPSLCLAIGTPFSFSPRYKCQIDAAIVTSLHTSSAEIPEQVDSSASRSSERRAQAFPKMSSSLSLFLLATFARRGGRGENAGKSPYMTTSSKRGMFDQAAILPKQTNKRQEAGGHRGCSPSDFPPKQDFTYREKEANATQVSMRVWRGTRQNQATNTEEGAVGQSGASGTNQQHTRTHVYIYTVLPYSSPESSH